MQEEIKEILDYLKDFIEEDRLEQINLNRWFIISLLDYITNLQEENGRLKIECNALTHYLIKQGLTLEDILKIIEKFKGDE